MSALLIASGEQPGTPQWFAVLTALADDLCEPGRILHTLERSGGHEEESGTLLDDMRDQRFRIGRGNRYEDGARRSRLVRCGQPVEGRRRRLH